MKAPIPQGLFVVLEGADGAGTTTQQTMLVERLGREGEPVTAVSQPTKGERATAPGRLIRDMLEGREPPMMSAMGMQLLFAADRVELCRRDIDPALKAGGIVVSDRHTPSSIAYSLAGTPNPALHAKVASLLVEANRAATAPDLTIVLAVDPVVAAARRSARGGRPDAFEQEALQERVCALYKRFDEIRGERHPVGRLRFVDGNEAPDVVHEAICAHVVETLAARRAMTGAT